jgi:hypothetical protein
MKPRRAADASALRLAASAENSMLDGESRL